MDFAPPPELDEIRAAVRELCDGFPGEYWRGLEPDRYPEEFVAALTEGGWLGALVPEAYAKWEVDLKPLDEAAHHELARQVRGADTSDAELAEAYAESERNWRVTWRCGGGKLSIAHSRRRPRLARVTA